VDTFTLKKVEFNEVRQVLSRFCACSLGKALATRLNPSRNPDVIRRWLEQVRQMVRAVRDIGLPPFAGLTDVREPLTRAHPSGGATGEDFAVIAAALEGAHSLKDYLAALPEDLEALHELGEGLGRFDGEVKAVRNVVEPDGTIRDDASERLSRIRLEIQATSRRIHDVIYGYLQNPEVAKLLQASNVTLHGDRYVLPVKAENRGRLPGVVHRASNTGATVFVEPNACVELNNHLADLYNDERREIERLLNVLSIRMQGRATEMAATMRLAGQVDLISAKAQYAYQFGFTCPEVYERGDLDFRQARHPLLLEQEHRQEKGGVPAERRHRVVPIDVRLGSDFDLLVITGSNTGGKTVTLKTVALLVLMAQSGMHIPAARGARMCVFHDLFLDVGDEQSLQQSLSTFGGHVRRIRHILRKADKRSLVLLDELGAGTDPEEGGAIGQAVLDELRGIGCLGMATTHLSVLKAYAFNHARVDNASVDFDTKTMSPTYHLRIGTPGESHAIEVVRRLGMSRQIVSAAKQHLAQQGKQFRRAIRATGEARQVAEEARAQAVEAELAARSQQETYEAKLADLHRLQRDFETWLATLPDLRPGDEVLVPSLNKTGRLVRLELHRQVAVVDADNVQVEVPLKSLMPDLGQSGVREQIASLRQQILDQAKQTEAVRAEAEHIRQEYHRSLEQQKARARQFDTWLGAIARVKVGDEVPIACRPGRGTVKSVDLPGLRATLETEKGELTVSIQDLFPQTGPFAPREDRRPARRGEKRPERRPEGRGERGRGRQPAAPRRDEAELDKPMHRGRSAHGKREALLALQPGDQVYVVPFHKRATLVRLQAEKELATVQSGIFEMQVPLADLEPIRKREPEPAKPADKPAEAPKAAEPAKAEPRTPEAEAPADEPSTEPPAAEEEASEEPASEEEASAPVAADPPQPADAGS